MSDSIDIPSPSIFLARSDSPPSASKPGEGPPQTKKKVRRKTASDKAQPPPRNPVRKQKLSKSRNGCATCKQKRLKCDETKPACTNCQKKGLPCGGYRKVFQWRPFEESQVKTNIDRQGYPHTSRSISDTASPTDGVEPPAPSDQHNAPEELAISEPATSNTAGKRAAISPSVAQNEFPSLERATKSPDSRRSPANTSLPQFEPFYSKKSAPEHAAIPPGIPCDLPERPISAQAHAQGTKTPSSPTASGIINFKPNVDEHQYDEISQPDYDLLLGDTTPDCEVFMDRAPLYQDVDQFAFDEPQIHLPLAAMPAEADFLPVSTPIHSPGDFVSFGQGDAFPLYDQPFIALDSPEHLLGRFDSCTCGILSMMDGPDENPWRVLVWPMAQQSPALYHAILAMTAFHASKDEPELRIAGGRHKSASIRNIREGLRDSSISIETGIATALALGFAESWDHHIATGNEHIKGAQVLVNRALQNHHERPKEGIELKQLKFLCNSWVYMDVIARMTAVNSNDTTDFDYTFRFAPDSPQLPMQGSSQDEQPPGFGINFGMPIDARLDPLMGCASTLFPLIGRVGNLCKKVFRSKTTSAAVISEANDLKRVLENWCPPGYIDEPQDETTDPQHTVQTAEAYRFAALLHLHQAVPEIPSPTSEQLAQRVLQYLATVPIESRTIIVQIYPLMVAGCVVSTPDDRAWVLDRWDAMDARMRIGVIEKSKQVTEEVWKRTDKFEASPPERRQRATSTNDRDSDMPAFSRRPSSHDWPGTTFSYVEDDMGDFGHLSSGILRPFSRLGSSVSARRIMGGPMHKAYTIRGKCHWTGVMWDYGWQILLG